MANTVANLLMTDVETFLEVQNAFDHCDDDIKRVIVDMIGVYRDAEANDDEKRRAAWTIVEALFPLAAADVMDAEATLHRSNGAGKERDRLDEEERTFAERLGTMMKAKHVTQDMLAAKTGVGQPAICNMLQRACRPQKRTVARLAAALDVRPEELWPSIED